MPSDLEKLQGTWSITTLEADGNVMQPAFFEGAKIVITRDRFTSLMMGGTYEGTIRVDAKARPKTLDIDYTSGEAAGTRQLGIYELRGDRWRICLGTLGNERPTGFATKPSSGFVLETLVRGDVAAATAKPNAKRARATTPAKPHVPVAAPVTSSAPPTAWEGEWQMVSGVFGGVPMAEGMMQWATRVTRGDVTSVLAGPQVMLRARFTLDDSATPIAVEYVNLEGSNKGTKQVGIAELAGDTLRVCMAAPGQPAPTEFASTKGDGRSFTIWRRTAR